MYELKTVTVRGSAHQMGLEHGEQLRALIGGFVEQRKHAAAEYLAERGTHTLDELLATGKACAAVARGWDPEGYAEHEGIARAAGVDPDELYTTSNMTDIRDALLLASPGPGGAPAETRADAEGCSSLVLPPRLTRDGEILAGQTWDLNPTDLDFVVALHRLPEHGPETWSVTCAGCLTLMGMNQHGLAVGTTNLKIFGSRVGVGYLSVLHRAIRETTVAAAAQAVAQAPRAGAHSYWLAGAEAALDLECSATQSHERRLADEALARTNHCLYPEFERARGEEPSSSSHARLLRLQTEVAQRSFDRQAFIALMSNRSDGVDSINRYPEDGQSGATNACVIARPAARELWACRGPADRGAWTRLRFERG